MFDTSPDTQTFGDNPASPLCDLRSFADEHHEALLDAAGLLGGAPGFRLTQAALDGLAEQKMPSRKTLHALNELLGLLTLEHVHDPERIEAERFAQLDPADPCVEEICLLADQLGDALNACRDEAAYSGESLNRRYAA